MRTVDRECSSVAAARVAHHGLRADETTRTYRLLFGTAVVLATLGAPLFMTGAVALSEGVSHATDIVLFIRSVLVFVVYALPMASAWIAWKAARQFESTFRAHL
jgi:hypothetical protein